VTGLPGRSTCCDLLKRHGLVISARRRRYPGHPGRPSRAITAPNELWTADFKASSRPGTAGTGYPLTVVDGYSRFLLGCQGFARLLSSLRDPCSSASSRSTAYRT